MVIGILPKQRRSAGLASGIAAVSTVNDMMRLHL
jgi:hypothetical protein